MLIIESISTLHESLRNLRMQRKRIALVPTMGNLHSGHLELVRRGREAADTVIVSIFVNPMQFERSDDLARYPHTLQQDIDVLRQRGADVLFAPTVAEIYPHGTEGHTSVYVPEISDILEGASRPGHFRGVATVVSKLFNLIQPDVVCFGEKDYQQLALIRKMIADMGHNIDIIAVPTVRDKDGLALSSRNSYLNETERQRAPALYQIMNDVAEKIRAGDRACEEILLSAAKALHDRGFRKSELYIRDAENLMALTSESKNAIILFSSWLGNARLIDNTRVNLL